MADRTDRFGHLLLGKRALPADVSYGIQTVRGPENVDISGIRLRLYPDLITALAMVKLAAAGTNAEDDALDPPLLAAIEGACLEVIDGKLHDQFHLEVFHGDTGPSMTMNAHEVIADRALELMGYRIGDYQGDNAHHHQNASQSTRDAASTALHVGLALGNVRVVAAINSLIESFRAKGRDVDPMLELGQPRLQDAMPMTPGRLFNAFAATLAGEVRRLEAVQWALCEITIGATVNGTDLKAPPGWARKYASDLAAVSGLPLHLAADPLVATQDTEAFVLYSSCVNSLASKLSKVCNDLRLLSSDSRCRMRQINLPSRQLRSSTLPGQVDPVISEVVNRVSVRVIDDDQAITPAAGAGRLRLNLFEPWIAARIFEAHTICINAADEMRVICLDGIDFDSDVCPH